jgi:glycine/D-amino acid oxidase-like deaminating enzyme/nitrite reductase/ring-hydroxylating ferredoxin subunit
MDEYNDFENGSLIPGQTHSLWIDTTHATDFPPLQRGITVDVAIIGGGIVGVTAAALLKDAGLTVAIIDMSRIIRSVTGHTTAKITSLHGIIYKHLLKRFSEDKVRTYGEANQSAIDKIESIVKSKKIECDFMRTPSFTYTELSENLRTVEAEAEAAQRVGLPASFVETTPLPFDVLGAVRFENQAQFHPRKYLLALASELTGNGGYIFENTRALDIDDGEPCVVFTDKGELMAKEVVLATHFPFYDKGLFFSRLFPHHSYAIGVRVKGDVPDGMHYTEDGKHYAIRNQPGKAGPMLVISGGYHKTGQGGDTMAHYEYLVRHTRERFDVESIDYYWSTEDYDSADMLPFIGLSPRSQHIYLATGFAGWGMTNGTLSAMLISDLILGRENHWASIFSPSRIDPVASGKEFVTENLNVAKQYATGLLTPPSARDLAELAGGEGKKLVINKKEVAAYKDEQGTVYSVSPICTHLACTVNWNNAEKTWDCPCHGSRYNYDGTVIHGPALRDLKKRDPETGEDREV